MDLVSGQIPKYSITPNGGVALIAASSNTVTLGSNSNGAYTPLVLMVDGYIH